MNINWKSWHTWVMLACLVLVVVLNFVFPSLGLVVPENANAVTLILWFGALIVKLAAVVTAGTVGTVYIKKAYDLNIAKAKSSLPKRIRSLDPVGDINSILQSIYADLDNEGVPYKVTDGNGLVTIDPIPVAPNISRILSDIWNDPAWAMSVKMGLLSKALDICSASFKSITGLDAPTTWAAVADYNQFWRSHPVNCKVTSQALFHQGLMPLRQVLKIKDTGDV